jgi:pyruvate,orthophosphate dikinase
MAALVGVFGDGALLSVRSSSQAPDWGGPGAILNIGMNDAVHARLEESFGTTGRGRVLRAFIRAYATDDRGWRKMCSTGR